MTEISNRQEHYAVFVNNDAGDVFKCKCEILRARLPNVVLHVIIMGMIAVNEFPVIECDSL